MHSFENCTDWHGNIKNGRRVCNWHPSEVKTQIGNGNLFLSCYLYWPGYSGYT